MTDVRKDEHYLIQQVAPLINQMGINAAQTNAKLNKALKLQLQVVLENLKHYIPTKPRGWGDDNQMPHEWGSLDSLDDMRNSMRIAVDFMDELLWTDNEVAHMQRSIAESGLCATSDEVLAIAFEGMNEDQIDARIDELLKDS